MTTVQFLISTIDEGIDHVAAMLLPPQSNVSYVIVHEQTETRKRPLPAAIATRADVKTIALCGKGLSRSRNAALDNASADLLVIADDDCRYTPHSIGVITETFAANPSLDIALFESVDCEGQHFVSYPEYSFSYVRRPRKYSPRSVEIVLRNSDRLPRFDSRFGLGSPCLACGEEEVFLIDAQARHLQIKFFPRVIVSTPRATTGTRFATDKRVRRSKGAVLAVQHGILSATLRCLKFAMCHTRGVGRATALADMLWGINYVRHSSK